MSDIYIYRISMPAKTKGVTVLKNGDYLVFVNECLCEEARQKAVKHELNHIMKNHLFDDCKVILQCESEAVSDLEHSINLKVY